MIRCKSILIVFWCLCKLGKSSDIESSASVSKKQVFLGGSCNPTTWRKDIAIPEFEKFNISYYNFQVDEWSPDLVKKEEVAKKEAEFILYVIDNQTRNVVSMVEIAQLAVTRRDSLYVVLSSYEQNQIIANERISARDYEELKNGLALLKMILEKQKIFVFSKIDDAINAVAKATRKTIRDEPAAVKVSNKTHCKDIEMDLNVGGVGEDVLRWLEVKTEKTKVSFKLLDTDNVTVETLEKIYDIVKKNRFIVLVISRTERSLGTMILAAHLMGQKSKLALCIQKLPKNSVVSGVKLTDTEVKDYDRGRTYVSNMANEAGVLVDADPRKVLEKAIYTIVKDANEW